MLPVTTFCAILLGGWSVFHLLYNILMSSNCVRNVIDPFMQRNHISVSLFQIRWFTKQWNRHFILLGKCCNLTVWFNAGVIFGFVAMFCSVGLLVHMLFQSISELPLFTKGEKVESAQVLKVIVPGVNLPIADIAYLLTSVLIAGVVHEFGHAIAAAREGVQVNGFGVFLFLIYPGAYVDLNSEDLAKSHPLKQLRIYCAGVWHNFILSLLACILIFYLPIMLSPFYANVGAVVAYQSEISPLHGDKGIQAGDMVKKISECSVVNADSWYSCINSTKHLPQLGSCASLSEVANLNTASRGWRPSDIEADSEYHCCDEVASQTSLCYSYSQNSKKTFACLPGRVVMRNHDCLTNQNCYETKGDAQKTDIVCVTPYLDDPSIRFTRIVVKRGDSYFHVLYYGNPNDLARFITISDFTPRLSFIPLRFPSMLLKFLQYIFSMSGALALLNIVPCYALDGQWAFKAFVDFFNGKPKNAKSQEKITLIVLTLGTLLVILSVVFGLVFVFSR